MNREQRKELLEYYWTREPVYHPVLGAAMPRGTVLKMRFLASLMLFVYLAFSISVWRFTDGSTAWHWLAGILLGAYGADLLSGLAHMYIDFAASDKRNLLHKELFLSRVHHHELYRPARLNYASLWFSPALYAFLLLVVIPVLLVMPFPPLAGKEWITPFWLSLIWFSSVSQVSHAFAHGKARHPVARRFVRILQACRLMIRPRTHLRHHREIDCNFSVLNGWSISFLNWVFKRWIEHRLPASTSPARQRSQMRVGLSFPYEEIL